MSDLFQQLAPKATEYSAKDIEVLEGLEPVRRRPGMYIGGTDDRALHHLVAEVLDNSMDEAVAGHAGWIELELAVDGTCTVRDNGRGIPVDPHPKYPDKSALEVILTTLHSGGKFGGDAYKVSGGLHGVGVSVVNALSDAMTVEVARDRVLWSQRFSRGLPLGPLEKVGPVQNRRGTTVIFHPDAQIFGERAQLRPGPLYRMARSKAYLFRGVQIRWKCDPLLIKDGDEIPAEDTLHFPGGLTDFLKAVLKERPLVTKDVFNGTAPLSDDMGQLEWAVAWPDDDEEGFVNTYCNTVPTPEGGTHEAGFRNALTKGLRAYGEMAGNKKAGQITAEDVMVGACVMVSLFIRDPQFQGQTKEKLASPEATRLVENAVKDHFDHWLSGDKASAAALLTRLIEKAEDRARRRQAKEMNRKTPTKRLRLPGKLADCSRSVNVGTELFLVEGDSAGGSAKSGRNRETQAILPLRGKILNVASASTDKLRQNQELKDLMEALGCGARDSYDDEKLRYEKIIIMTDADVDGAHIASLLMTFFYQEMPDLIRNGHLYLALPPLYRLAHGQTVIYGRDDAHKEELLKTLFAGKKNVEISRFKGLGEMPPAQLKETTMDPAKRTLLRVTIPSGRTEEDHEEAKDVARLVESLMGKKPELRFAFIQERAKFATDLDV
ncbi:Topoisomerase IV subunit B [Paramagnetospirillum magnetotacticum MS-1]|uniref:DNA topoisomerase 4 subunit B n=1 Tax=Paramagnetospirillum magnetotacticum MS-1 TaxID=272627 RepID=A0A0C2Z0Y0_PARME|nr:DNA topoisomerase IV subunit B [Paramagnetospirillum magnetotacticum]KIM00556.1 Topoisomerase IV subunit B [Paramagnetospirillum magnetotacticum MS-1]